MASGRKKLSPQRELRELRATVRELAGERARADLLFNEVDSLRALNSRLKEDMTEIQQEILRLTVEHSRVDGLEGDLRRTREEADATRAGLIEVSKYSRKVIAELVETIRDISDSQLA